MPLPWSVKTWKRFPMPSWTRWTLEFWGLAGLIALVGLFLGGIAETAAAKPKPKIKFDMMRSAAAANGNCLSNASGHVKVTSLGPVEVMDVEVTGLPPNTEFDFFVIQLPNAPFGLAWYQGDIETDDEGEGHQRFIGRFSIETFIVAQPPGDQPAPVVHHEDDQHPFPDADKNPATEPIHTFHLGLWFGSPEAAAEAGCPNTVTRFNGEHNAGIQVLSTHNFPDLEGPLQQLDPTAGGQ
jgi:hypothetical protein